MQRPDLASDSWPDLDSHLNLVDDPFTGLVLQDDRLHPRRRLDWGSVLQKAQERYERDQAPPGFREMRLVLLQHGGLASLTARPVWPCFATVPDRSSR